ncbi:amidase [Alisedimentitalea sp. MJ-SS2]|uniref:amidase n=1 Tax=Aliisedimentitalea sp. MJ-SS2 TaxID=3049795 RepID=UPI002908418A|nr:amidase [Alisedimentitalea sp. MJ-SS2]MDU8928803.1 amidase [Alisedimentitalea sp. MJ-SS2]
MSDLLYLTATDALARFADKTLSPVELLSAQITQAEATRETVNAFTYTHFDEAMDAARASESRWAKGEPLGSLDGLPVAIKDESHIAGKPTSYGSLIAKDYVPDTTSPMNQPILAAGAIVHARTATPEYSCAGFTWSRLWGVTRNPWNPEFTPGGSSGGSAASLAAGTSSLATGSDIGGSIRIPSSCCGLVGYKPPYGRNPDDIPFNLDFYCHTGPLARSVGDAILLQNTMSGQHPWDIASLPKITLPTQYPDIKGWKIALSMDLGSFQVSDDVRRNTLAAADTFRALGATVEEVDIGWGPEVPKACLAYLTHLFGGALSMELEEHGDKMTTYCRALAEKSLDSTAQDFVASLQTAGEAYMKLGPLLQDYDCLICPTNALPAVRADFDQSVETIEINGVEVDPSLGWVMTTPFNMMSRCPVISVPSGFAANGVPTGLQIVGPAYRDEIVFQAALSFEAAQGGWFNESGTRPRFGG